MQRGTISRKEEKIKLIAWTVLTTPPSPLTFSLSRQQFKRHTLSKDVCWHRRLGSDHALYSEGSAEYRLRLPTSSERMYTPTTAMMELQHFIILLSMVILAVHATICPDERG